MKEKNINGIYLHCPLCGGNRRKASDIVCPKCYQSYTNEAAIELTRGNYINLWEWTKRKVADLLPEIEQEYARAKNQVDQLRAKVHHEALAEIKKASYGKFVPKNIFDEAYFQKRQQLWKQLDGNKVFAQMKALESRISFIKEILAKEKEGAKVISLAQKQ